ncbi:MAG TPA: ATP-binding protein [Stellaceae bacterium]|nr:ATP-binding protein [Stellaceae bacterium]
MAIDGAQGGARTEEQRLRDYAEAAADWFWEMDADLRFTRMSASTHLPETYESQDFIGRRLDEVRGLGVAGDDWQPLAALLEARLPFRDVRLVCRGNGGGHLHLSFSGLPLFAANGSFAGYRGIGRDLTLLKRAEEDAARAQRELAAMSGLLRATLDNMEQGLLVLDGELRLWLWNDRMFALFGHNPKNFWVGRPFAEMVREYAGSSNQEQANMSIAFTRRVNETGKAAVREFMAPNGCFIEMRVTPMPEGGAIATYSDISEQKRVEGDLRRAKEEAELASRSKSEFLANMSHELRTPLNAIIGFADILRGEIFGPLGDSRYADYATDIRDSGLHLLKLINDVLDVSKVEFGKIELAEEAVDIVGVIEGCIRLMRERVDAAGLHLNQAMPVTLPLVQCDELRMKQVLLNLLSNAVKFTPAGGTITVRARLTERGLGITVEDTGIGIAPGDIEKALRPFGQIDSRLARKYQGTGLGLPLAKSMIELHGGRLDIESTAGEGTRVTLWLPIERMLFPAGGRRVANGED